MARCLSPSCCRLLLPQDQNGRFPELEPAAELGGPPGRLRRRSIPRPGAVRDMFKRGGGERVYALVLMQEDPAIGDLGCALDAISRSRSAFEQYQALDTALRYSPSLTIRSGSNWLML